MRQRPSRARCPQERKLRGSSGLEEYDRGACPDHLLTRRQLRDALLSPGGNRGPVAILRLQALPLHTAMGLHPPRPRLALRPSAGRAETGSDARICAGQYAVLAWPGC